VLGTDLILEGYEYKFLIVDDVEIKKLYAIVIN